MAVQIARSFMVDGAALRQGDGGQQLLDQAAVNAMAAAAGFGAPAPPPALKDPSQGVGKAS